MWEDQIEGGGKCTFAINIFLILNKWIYSGRCGYFSLLAVVIYYLLRDMMTKIDAANNNAPVLIL